MKTPVLILCITFLTLTSCNRSNNTERSTEELVEQLIVEEQNEQVLRHVVLFKFKESATEADIQQIVEAFRELPNEIEGILDFEWGTNVSPEGLSNDFTHSFLITFEDEEARDAYLPHPAHKAFGGIVGPHLDKVLVVDYWPQE